MGVPENMRGAGSAEVKNFVIEPLLYLRTDGTVQPYLAESYEWSDDYLSLTLNLRKGVTFHDGTPFDAQAVKWNWDKRAEAHAAGTMDVVSAEIIDDYTFRLNIKAYKNTWMSEHLCSTGQSQTSLMISPTAYETNGVEWANWNPVGTGPFKFKSYIPGQSMEVERYEDYWGERPYLDGIKWLFIADAVTAQIAFEAGQGDTLSVTGHDRDIGRDLLPKTEKGYWALTSPGLEFILMPPGAKAASPFSNLKVREALEYAVDKEKIVKGVYFGWAVAAYQEAETHQVPYDPNFVGRKYDPDKARQLLAEAGYPNGFKTSLYCQVLCYGKDIDAVQAYLQNVGIDAQMEVISVGKWIEMETYGWDDGILVTFLGPATWGGGHMERDYVKPTEPNWSHGLWWETMYRPDELEVLCQQYLSIRDDPVAEKAKSQEIVKLLFDQAILIPLWEQKSVTILQPYVKCTDTSQTWYTGDIRGRSIGRFWLDK
jgi:ABC-type transport system substrate-binding protein